MRPVLLPVRRQVGGHPKANPSSLWRRLRPPPIRRHRPVRRTVFPRRLLRHPMPRSRVPWPLLGRPRPRGRHFSRLCRAHDLIGLNGRAARLLLTLRQLVPPRKPRRLRPLLARQASSIPRLREPRRPSRPVRDQGRPPMPRDCGRPFPWRPVLYRRRGRATLPMMVSPSPSPSRGPSPGPRSQNLRPPVLRKGLPARPRHRAAAMPNLGLRVDRIPSLAPLQGSKARLLEALSMRPRNPTVRAPQGLVVGVPSSLG